MVVKNLMLPLGLPLGPRSMIMDKPREPSRLVDAQGDYITFVPKKIGCAKPPNKKKKNKKGNDYRVRTWLIMSAAVHTKGKDTAIGSALMSACINRLISNNVNAGAIIRNVVEMEKRRASPHPIPDAPSQSTPSLPPSSVSKDTSWKLYKDGWFIDASGVFMRVGPVKHEHGYVHHLHLGKSAYKKPPAYMSRLEERRYENFVKGEVSCG